MNLRNHSEKLVHFHFVAQYKSFRLAAKASNLSQPALSQSIQNLEHALKTPLFIRSQKGAELSYEGKLLYSFTQKWFPALDQIEKKLLSPYTNKKLSGLLRFSSYQSLLDFHGVNLISQTKKKHSSLITKLISYNSTNKIMAAVLQNEVDCALLVEPEKNTQLVSYPIYKEHFVFSASSKIAKKKLSKSDLNLIPLLYFPNALSGKKRLLRERLLDLNISQKNTDISTGSYSILLELAYQSYGIIIAPSRIISNSIYAKKLQPVNIVGIPKKLGSYGMDMIFRKTSVHHPQHKILLNFIQSVINGH